MRRFGELRRSGVAIVAGLALWAACAPLARAAEGGDPLARVRAALARATSYSVDFNASTYSQNGTLEAETKGETIVVLPDSYHTFEAIGKQGTYEEILKGPATYTRVNGGPWSVRKTSPRAFAALQVTWRKYQSGMKALPDRSEDGSLAGAFSWHSQHDPHGSSPGDEVCTYDKTTYLLRACTTTSAGGRLRVVKTYSKWNDPSNEVVAPPGVLPPARPAPPAPVRSPAATP